MLKCDLGGEYTARKASTTNSSSRRTGCTYEIVCSVKEGVWGVRKVEGGHNHSIQLDLSGHAIARRPNPEEKQLIINLARSGVAPKNILNQLKHEFNNHTILAEDIYRVITKEKKEVLDGRSFIEALADVLNTNDYISAVQIKEYVKTCPDLNK